jgi:hypothetical protein
MNKFYFIIKYCFIENLVISLLSFLIRLILFHLSNIPNNFSKFCFLNKKILIIKNSKNIKKWIIFLKTLFIFSLKNKNTKWWTQLFNQKNLKNFYNNMKEITLSLKDIFTIIHLDIISKKI